MRPRTPLTRERSGSAGREHNPSARAEGELKKQLAAARRRRARTTTTTASALANSPQLAEGERGRKRSAVRRWAGAQLTGEVGAQAGGGAEAAALGDPLEGLVGGLEQALGQQHPLAEQPLQRSGAGGGDEAAGEGARAQGGPAGGQPHGAGLRSETRA